MFSAVGAVYGLAYDAAVTLERLIPLKVFEVILDFLLMLSFSVVYVCFVIAYCGGNIRAYTFGFVLLGFSAYMLTLHKVISQVFNFFTAPWVKLLKFLSKKLKNSKKSYKKLLHLPK